MIASWFSAHKSLAITSLSSTVVVALVSTLAVLSGGYPSQKMHLNDASVWVASQSRGMLGRANTQIAKLDTVVDSTSKQVDVAQSGLTVLMIDAGDNTIGRVDVATGETGKSVPLPPRSPVARLVGTTAVIGSATTGQFWNLPVSQLSSFTAEAQPSVDLGGRAVTSLAPDGTMFAYLPDTRQLRTVDVLGDGTVSTVANVAVDDPDDTLSITSVGDTWVLFDATTGTLHLASGSIHLSRLLAGASDAVLEKPAAAGDTVYVSSSHGLIAVPLHGGSPRLVHDGELGAPAAPVSVHGCTYAGWAGGTSWTSCGAAKDARTGRLRRMPANASLTFQVNGDRVVLNDVASGVAWAVQDGNAVIDNWDELATKKDETQQVEQNNVDKPPVYDKTQKPPVAVDDKLGARPGRANPLPVLMNDYDPNGDVLVITAVTPIPAQQGTIDIVDNAQQLQFTPPAGATGSVSFDYTITDGRGGSASAHVTVTLRTDDENSAPRQFRHSKALVRQGGRTTTQVLSDWYDPDGDPMFLASATVDAPDQVTFTPQGSVVFTDAGKGGSLKTVGLVVSDSRASGNGSLSVTVRPRGSVPIITDPFVVTATAGQETRISPLPHVRGGTGTVRLSSVQGDENVTLTPDYQAGTFRFSSTSVGSHYVDYAVTDGTATATGVVRVEVHKPLNGKTAPITVPHTAFIRPQSTQDVDVLATDIDPAGGVLLVTGISDVPADSGLRVQILQQRTLRVTLTRPLEHPVEFHYTVSNGLAQSTGTVTVIELPALSVRQPPVAKDDSVAVRVGDVVDIPVLDNDSQPDGEELTLDAKLVAPLPAGDGLLFASGNRLRYLAPHKTGDFTATYRVSASDGQWASAQVKISVREPDASTNNPPVPKTVTARVFAGDTVRIPIPLSGIDPDGDSVRLIGQDSNPSKGAVTQVGSDWIEYQAGDYSAGTDTFGYSVVDALGARASGTVRVGIAAKTDTAAAPIAVEDEVTVRPGRTVAVQVLANDSDPDNSPLKVTAVTPTTKNAGTAETDGTLVTVTAPKKEGRYGFIYSIANDRGGTSSNFLSVVVSTQAPLVRPVASDTQLALSDILDRTTIDVNVLANVFFADGPVSSLDLSVLGGYTRYATVTANKRIRVTIRDHNQIIPFRVANPAEPSLDAYAFIWVPGFDDALPQLKRGVDALTVPSESKLTIDLNKYVVAAGGKTVRLTDSSTVRATHADGSPLVKNDTTLVFTSAKRYFGPASISFQVTDGTSAHAPGAHTATLVLPIDVTPRQNQPPVFTGGTIDFEPGQSKTLDLVKLTSYPYQKDLDELEYRLIGSVPAGFSASLNGRRLTVHAAESTPKNTTVALTVGVKDAINTGQSGRLQLEVVPSTRPLAVPAPDQAITVRGKTTVVDVLANDQATNPFPAVPLKVVAVRGLDAANLPSGVTITPSADKSRLNVTVSKDAAPQDVNLQYEVQDATKDPDRDAWGSVRLSIQDKPDPVADLRMTSVGDRKLTLSWDPGAANNSPISGFEVTTTSSSGSRTTPCAVTVCTISTPGNGPANGLSVSVRAENSVGLSKAVALGQKVWSNVVPPAPDAVAVSAPKQGEALTVTWKKPDTGAASPITSYWVSLGDQAPRKVGADTFSTRFTGLKNGTSYTVTVQSRNSFPAGSPQWNSSEPVTGTPAGPPTSNGSPSVTVATSGAGNTATVSWAASLFNDQGRPITRYVVAGWNSGSSPACADGAPSRNGAQVWDSFGPDARSDAIGGLSANTSYEFVVFAVNAQGCVMSASAGGTPHSAPAPPRDVSISGPAKTGDAYWGTYTITIGDQPPLPGEGGTITWKYRTSDGQTGTIGASKTTTLDVSGKYDAHVQVSVWAVAKYSDGVSVEGDKDHASTATSSGVPVSLGFTNPGFTPRTITTPPPADPGTGDGTDDGTGDSTDAPEPTVNPATFSWTGVQLNPSAASATYSCVDGETHALGTGAGSCTASTSDTDPALTVTISANGKTYTVTYEGADFD